MIDHVIKLDTFVLLIHIADLHKLKLYIYGNYMALFSFELASSIDAEKMVISVFSITVAFQRK